jgi:hypothetical protein
MTTKSTIGSKSRPRAMFSAILKPMAEAQKGCSGEGCRAKALTRLNREGMAACQAGDFDGGVELLSQGIRLASRAGTRMYEAKLRNNLGLVLLLAKKPCEAAGEFGRALTLVEDKLGRDNSLFKRIEGNLSRIHCAQA